MTERTLNDTAVWDNLRGIIRSRIGGWRVGQDVRIHGRGLLGELLGEISYVQLLMFNISGRLPERALADWVEGTFMCLSWPDARIWCNQIATLAGGGRTSPVASVAAGLLASDSSLYGPGTVEAATGFIVAARQAADAGESVPAIVGNWRRTHKTRAIPGYGRPVAKGDERVAAMIEIAARLGFIVRPHLELAFAIERHLQEEVGESMNLAGYIMAFLSDQSWQAHEIYALYSVCVEAGLLACHMEASAAVPDSFMPLRCDDVDYQGPPIRRYAED